VVAMSKRIKISSIFVADYSKNRSF
jgi:hypothetical protein